ncbi:putative protein kinase C and casein kinase substrate in neurons 2 protein-like [Apostichopus japonicus]|uniref:SH3 domain-containing protein n=1 Tax=Stichopus japonicus TaxID=307972 RepID=A0A2G8L432_STIJA|nr:putative protein kinase C and casein kinase substrate in neurons 2 protein-like [Apostichopus japonicus]
MSGASTTLLEASRAAYNDVTKANPDMDVQEWVLSFNLNTFIELPSFEEFIAGSEEYETVQESQKPQKPSGSFFQLSLFGSSSDQDDSSDSESESSSSSDSSSTSRSESDSSAATRVSSLSNVSRKSKKTATNGKSAIQPRDQHNSRPHSNVPHHRQQSNNHIGNADISVQRQTSGQWDRVTEPSARNSTTQSNSSQLSVNQSTPKVSARADETTTSYQGDVTTKSDIQTAYAHTSKSTGFSIDNNTVDVNETSQTSAVVHNRDTNQLQDANQSHDLTFGKVDAISQTINNVTTDNFSNAITSVAGEPSAHDRLQSEYRGDNEQPSIDEKPITDESSVISSSYANLSELRKENDLKSKGMHTHEPGGVETQKGCLDNNGETVFEQDITPVKNTKKSYSSFYKNTQWSPVCPPLTCDKNEQNAINSSESKERKQVKEGDAVIRQRIDVNTTNCHHENLCHFSQEPNHQGPRNNGVNPPTGDFDRRHGHHRCGLSECCQLLEDDDLCVYRAPQTMFSPDKCLARWFLGRYPEYEQLGENMWRRLQKTNPTRYQAALMDAKKLMLFVDTRSSNHPPNIANVDICNSFHTCRRQYDQRHHCGCVYEGPDQEKKGQDASHKKNYQVTQAEDKFCQEVTSRLLRSHQSLHDTKQSRDEDKCGLQGSSEHMCRVAAGLILGKNTHDESERLDSLRCDCREPSQIHDEKQRKDWNVRSCSCHQRREDFTDETYQEEDRTLDSSDESDFSTDVSPSDADNTRITIHVDDRHKADNDAREALKPTDGEFLVKALYKFSPANWDELRLRTGEYLIQIGQDSENGWAMGRTKTKQGLFPASYVKFVKK